MDDAGFYLIGLCLAATSGAIVGAALTLLCMAVIGG